MVAEPRLCSLRDLGWNLETIERVLIVGAGWTGRQIAAQCAVFGRTVCLVEPSSAVCADAKNWVIEHVEARRNEGLPVWIQADPLRLDLQILPPSQLGDSQAFDLVIECVPETPSIKRRVLREYSDRFPSPTIIASNSSYFTPSMLSGYVTDTSRFAHLHFHAPIWRATIVDVVGCNEAKPEVLHKLDAFARSIGQTPIVQTVENPGYIFNFILQSMLISALKLVDRKVASPESIELSWKTVTGMHVGPFGMMDWIGLDLIQKALINARWLGDYEEIQRYADFLQPWIDQGALGVKAGRGFFEYESNDGKQG